MRHKYHIIPRHAGGTDDPSNLIDLTVEDHAAAHKLLWEQFGRWQDYFAWQSLVGIMKDSERIKILLSNAGKSNKGRKHKPGRRSPHAARIGKRVCTKNG
jgi:hypothetical protein